MSNFHSDSIFWIETDKIKANPFQPRREFDDARLNDLADSIRMYGILQPLVVTRREVQTEEGGIKTEYELISGERRLRASRLAGLVQVPALIRTGENSDREKLELAIIENLQREDLNVVERARAFEKLIKEFGFKHGEVGKKVGKSREYVTNTVRVLLLPEHILDAVSEGKISEGHTRPILMLVDKPQEQDTLFREIMDRRLSVRDAEKIARSIAVDRARKIDKNPEITEMESMFQESLGTRVMIEPKPAGGGKITIHFFSTDDLKTIFDKMNKEVEEKKAEESMASGETVSGEVVENSDDNLDDRSKEERVEQEEDESLYSLKDFSI